MSIGYDSRVELPNGKDLICEEIGQYIERTERFKEIQKFASRLFFPINVILELFLPYVSVY